MEWNGMDVGTEREGWDMRAGVQECEAIQTLILNHKINHSLQLLKVIASITPAA